MRSERKVNLIKALKQELNYYKKEALRTYPIDRTGLNHLQLNTVYTAEMVYLMPKDELREMVKQRISNSFGDVLKQLPVKTEYDEQFRVYRATLDLWVKAEMPY